MRLTSTCQSKFIREVQSIYTKTLKCLCTTPQSQKWLIAQKLVLLTWGILVCLQIKNKNLIMKQRPVILINLLRAILIKINTVCPNFLKVTTVVVPITTLLLRPSQKTTRHIEMNFLNELRKIWIECTPNFNKKTKTNTTRNSTKCYRLCASQVKKKFNWNLQRN